MLKQLLNLIIEHTMKANRQKRTSARDARQARQANRVVNGIFIGLILLMVLALIAYYLLV